MGILDLYENFRKSKSKVESNKPKKRNYKFEDGFTGDKRLDMNSSTISSEVSDSKNKRIDNSRDER